MKDKPVKSFRALASELKARRKPKLTDEEVSRLNKMFEEIEKQGAPKGTILDTNILIS